MNKDFYLKQLKNTFDHFKFFPIDHHYEFNNQKIGMSVTKLIEQYSNKFDQQSAAERTAINENKDILDVLAEWKYKNEFSKAKGSTCHEYTQSLWSGEKYNFIEFDKSDQYYKAVKKIQLQANHFYNDYKDDLIHLIDEAVIGSEEFDIASAIDHIFIDKKTNDLYLVDYKTNSNIHKYENRASNMKIPLAHLKDTILNHYYLQLSLYKYIVELYSKLKVNKMFIVWFSELNDDY